MSLSECQRSHTNREFKTIVARKEARWNELSRDDIYLMQLAQLLFQIRHPKSAIPEINKFKLKMERNKNKKKPKQKRRMTPQEAGDIAAARWRAAVGYQKYKKRKNGNRN